MTRRTGPPPWLSSALLAPVRRGVDRVSRLQAARREGTERQVLLAITVVDNLVAVSRRRRDQGARLARLLLGLAVSRLGRGMTWRRRQARPACSSCQQGHRAPAAKEAAHLSKYRRPEDLRHRDAARVNPPEKCIRERRDIAPGRRRVVARCKRSITMSSPHTTTPRNPFRSPRRALDLPIGRLGHGAVRDCRSSANRRGLCAPMAKVS